MRKLKIASVLVAMIGVAVYIFQLDSDTSNQAKFTQIKSSDFPWHLLPTESAPTVLSEPNTDPTVESAETQSLFDLPGLMRQRALAEMRQGRFTDVGAYLHARDSCLFGGKRNAEQGCDPAEFKRDDTEALRLLQGGADRSLPEAELALAQWWFGELFRASLMLNGMKDAPTDPAWAAKISTLQDDASRARSSALTVLARAAPHNKAAATRLEELNQLWPTLER